MSEYKLTLTDPPPFFAELPYFVWGEVNYDSEGDCKHPRDRNWTWITLTHRETGEYLAVSSADEVWTVFGPDPSAARLARFLMVRSAGQPVGAAPDPDPDHWDEKTALRRAARVQEHFENKLLRPFAVDHAFWGSWKWIGWFGTDATWAGRWIMDSLVRNDPRAVALCIDWLRGGTYAASEGTALRDALEQLTDMSFDTDSEWVSWYDSDGGRERYPAPDIEAWFEELKILHKEP